MPRSGPASHQVPKSQYPYSIYVQRKATGQCCVLACCDRTDVNDLWACRTLELLGRSCAQRIWHDDASRAADTDLEKMKVGCESCHLCSCLLGPFSLPGDLAGHTWRWLNVLAPATADQLPSAYGRISAYTLHRSYRSRACHCPTESLISSTSDLAVQRVFPDIPPGVLSHYDMQGGRQPSPPLSFGRSASCFQGLGVGCTACSTVL